MAIDSINRIPNFQVVETNEANDDERRREKKKGADPKKGNASNAEKLAPPKGQNSEQEGSDTKSLQSQPVDTDKVIELLAHRPATDSQAVLAKMRVISKIASVKKPSPSTPKPLNKSA